MVHVFQTFDSGMVRQVCALSNSLDVNFHAQKKKILNKNRFLFICWNMYCYESMQLEENSEGANNLTRHI
jgi:hypothetical protein